MDRVQHAIRNRFHRHDKHGDDKREHAKGDHQNEQEFHMVDGKEMEDSSTGPENTVIDGNHDNQEGKVTTEVGVYEQQLTQLQEQLVSAMIENQTLTSQLREFTEKNKVDELKEDLEKEREKCQQLQLKLDAARVRVSSTGREVGGVEAADVTQGVEVASPADDFVHVTNVVTAPDLQTPPKPTILGRVWEWFIVGVYQLLEDLEPLETKSEEEEEGPELTVKQLKENIKRFKDALTPYIRTIKGINNLLTWKSPSFTGLVFALYMYMVYCGYLLPFTLFLLSLRLGINCLRHRGLNLPFNYLDCGEEEKKDVEEKEIGMSDKFNLVLFVARKVQNILGSLADSLEKIKNLLTWNEPMAARKLLSVLLTGFCLSLYFPASTLFYFGGLYFGLKLFVIDFIYGRYPRIKHKHDTTYIIWLSLPTNEELQKRNTKSEIHKHILRNASSEPDMSFNSSTDHITSDDKSFCELFSFPLSECPLPGWHGGRRCTLINRDKSLTSAFKNGRLFLTRSFLCFERSKTPTPKNLVIPLSEISKVERAKPYSWMPGGGMAIEITLGSSDKHMVFGAFLNRDETFTSIMSAGLKGEQPWATTTTTDSPTGSPALRRSFKSSQHHKVSKHSTL